MGFTTEILKSAVTTFTILFTTAYPGHHDRTKYVSDCKFSFVLQPLLLEVSVWF